MKRVGAPVRSLLLGIIILAIFSLAGAPVFADELGELKAQVEQSKSSPERISALMEMLSQGQSMHREGHRQGDMGKLLTSLRILDELKAEIAPWIYEFRPPDAS